MTTKMIGLPGAACALLLGFASGAQAAVAPYAPDASTLILYNFENVTGSVIQNKNASTPTGALDGVYSTATAATATPATPLLVGSYAGFGNALNNYGYGTRFYGVGVDVSGDDAWNYDGATNQDDFSVAQFFTNAATGVGQFTFEAMVYVPYIDTPAQTAFHQEIWASDTATGTRAFQFRIDDGGTLRFDAAPLGVTNYDITFNLATLTGPHAFAANQWFHVAVTYKYDGVNPATTRLYWTRVDSGATSANMVAEVTNLPMTGFATATSSNLVFGNEGRTNGGMSEGVQGLLDEGRVSTVARAANEFVFSTNPGDADGDGLLDTWEIQYFGDLSQTASGDPDGDGFDNAAELAAGSNPTLAASTPTDVDGDGLLDSWEVTYFGTILSQNGSGDPDLDFATNAQEQAGSSNPTSAASTPDTDGDGLNDGWEVVNFGSLSVGNIDSDGDGYNNAAEMAAGSNPNNISSTPAKAVLAHRWSFNGDLLDSAGSSNAQILDPDTNSAVGGGFTQSASEVTLAGGAGGTSAYISLGSNLIGGKKTPVTIELWATPNAVQNWGRIFDFGSSTSEYLFMSWTQGTNAATDQVEWLDAGVVSRLPNTNATYTLSTKYHIVLVLTPAVNTAGALTGGTRVTWYTAPANSGGTLTARGTFDTANHLANLNDVNNWLGRSMWFANGDNTSSAAYDEVRIWDGALSATEVNAYHLAGPNAFTLVDTDADGLSDAWEILYFRSAPEESDATILAKYDGSSDPDGDGFNNAAEYAAGSNPMLASSTPSDTDGDGLDDTWEISNFGNLGQTGSGDFDSDGASNLAEFTAGTDPKNAFSYPDADGDGLPDPWEVLHFGSISAYNDFDDPDGDGWINYDEYYFKFDPLVQFSSPDSDTDGLPDGWEIHYFIQSGEVAVNDRATIVARCVPTDDTDGDGFTNAAEFAALSDPTSASSVPGDLDGDGLLDAWESFYLGGSSASPTADTDGDSVNNLAEFLGGSNPNDAASKPATLSAYAADASTIHLWHFNESAAPALDSAAVSPLNLAALGNGATIGGSGITGLGGNVGTAASRGTTASAYVAPAPLTTTALDITDSVTTALADATSTAFTYEALVRLDFDPTAVQPTGAASNAMQILSLEGDDAGTNRVFHFRLVPRGALNTGAAPLLQFTNLTGTVQTVSQEVPSSGANAAVFGGWYHVAVSYSGTPAVAGNLKLYWTRVLNGTSGVNELASSTLNAGLPTSSTGMLVVGNEGRNFGGYSENFVGRIDEVRMSSTARSAGSFYWTVLPPPAAPTGLSATAGNAQVSLTWTAVSGATTYTIKRGTSSGGPYTTISAGAVVSPSYTDTGLTNGTTYYYVVSAVGSGGESANSDEVGATPVNPFSALQSWRLGFFGSADNSGSGADDADPDGDGYSNLIEYALRLDPTVRNPANLPTVALSGSQLTLTFAYRNDPSLVYTIEAGSNPGAMTSAQVYTGFGANGTQVYTDSTTVGTGTVRFLRLKVTY